MSEESGWKALGYGVGITEIPLMIFIGYEVGKRIGRETEGIIIGGLVGTILLATYAVWAFKKNQEMKSSRGKPGEQPTRVQQTRQQSPGL